MKNMNKGTSIKIHSFTYTPLILQHVSRSSSCSRRVHQYIQIIQQIKILVVTNCGYHKVHSRCAELVNIMWIQ